MEKLVLNQFKECKNTDPHVCARKIITKKEADELFILQEPIWDKFVANILHNREVGDATELLADLVNVCKTTSQVVFTVYYFDHLLETTLEQIAEHRVSSVLKSVLVSISKMGKA